MLSLRRIGTEDYVMKKYVPFLLFLYSVIYTPKNLIAQQTPFSSSVSNVGTTAAAFLNIGVGSRANAMGGAFTAMADDATALYWNPAGLANLEMSELNGMITSIRPRPEYTPDVKLNGHDILGYKNG